jgi:hypothetical protein
MNSEMASTTPSPTPSPTASTPLPPSAVFAGKDQRSKVCRVYEVRHVIIKWFRDHMMLSVKGVVVIINRINDTTLL